MKKQIITIAAFILMLTATTAYAQSNQIVKANIPFEFEMQGKTLPAGEYILERRDIKGDIWRLAGEPLQSPAVFLAQTATDNSNRGRDSKITFRRYGSRYFLAGVTTSDYKITLSKSKREHQVRREFESGDKLAKAEIVTIVAGE